MKPWMRITGMLPVGLLLLLGMGPVIADDDNAPIGEVTFAKDVLPVLQKNCQTCHRPGGDNYTGMVAPMALMTYEDVRPWAKSIAREVGAHRMPPWKASPEFHGIFKNERSLTDVDRATLEKWVAGGARLGRPEDAPPPLVFPDHGGWRIGAPDLVVKFDKPFLVKDDVSDQYANVTVQISDAMLPESRWVKAIEWRGGSNVVHHIVGYALPAGSGGGAAAFEGGYGLGSIAPGEEPMNFPAGYAKLLLKGSKLMFNMHYHKEAGPGTAVEDVSMVAFKFYPKDAKIEHFVQHNAIGHHAFELPPGQPNWKVGAARVFETDTTLLTLHPHMHLRGKNAQYVAHYPDGKQEVILQVPAWDFNWQTDYNFREPKRLPAGTRLEYTAHFDNSSANPVNPDPKSAITWGGRTTDEMMLGYITYADTQPREVTMESARGLMNERRRIE